LLSITIMLGHFGRHGHPIQALLWGWIPSHSTIEFRLLSIHLLYYPTILMLGNPNDMVPLRQKSVGTSVDIISRYASLLPSLILS
jgi:hypothetical protein